MERESERGRREIGGEGGERESERGKRESERGRRERAEDDLTIKNWVAKRPHIDTFGWPF